MALRMHVAALRPDDREAKAGISKRLPSIPKREARRLACFLEGRERRFRPRPGLHRQTLLEKDSHDRWACSGQVAIDTSVDTREEKLHNSLVLFEHGQDIVGKRRVGRSAPNTVNSSVRTREYLTTAEIERLMAAARKSSRYGHRDATMILIGYRHGLRASELCDLQWSQVELTTGRLHVRRAKNGSPSVHPMQGDEIRALRRVQREQKASSHVFMTERDGPMTPKAFHALFGRIGSRAKVQFPIHPHMLRHGCGYALANAGHDTRALQAWLGHKNIQHTVRYTELAPDRFKNFWR
jgi:integrase